MSHAVVATVNSEKYNNQTFVFYTHDKKGLITLTKEEAVALESVLKGYPEVFSELKIIPRDNSEIKLLDTDDLLTNLDFSFEEVQYECPDILDRLSEAIENRVSGIDWEETKRQTNANT